MTASHAQAIGSCGKGLETLIQSLMLEYYYPKAEPERYSNVHTERGNALEDSAAFLYQVETGAEISKVGFVIYSDYVGCSPDLFVDPSGMVEIKCPADTEYFRLLMGGEIKSEYIWQMQMQMLCCERSWCDFVAYNPNFDVELIIRRVEPDEKKQAKLEEGFLIGIDLIKEIERKYQAIINPY
jgi:hypothetical protein